MKQFFIVLLLVLVNPVYSSHDLEKVKDQNSPSIQFDVSEKAKIEEAINLKQTHGGKLWSGFDKISIPLLIYDDTIAFLIGIRKPVSGWKEISSGSQKGSAWLTVPGDSVSGKPYYYQLLDSGSTPGTFVVQVGKYFVASFPTHQSMKSKMGLFLAGNAENYITLIIHECFHAYQAYMNYGRLRQAEQVLGASWKKYPWNNKENNSAFNSIINILLKAYEADTRHETDSLLKSYWAARNDRINKSGMDSDMIKLEQLREWEEGLAKYTELLIYKLANADSAYTPKTEILNDNSFNNYKSFSQKWGQEFYVLKNQPQGDEIRFYYSGLIKALLLDKIYPNWKTNILKNKNFLDDLLIMYLNNK